MSVLQKLTENIVERDLQREGSALLNKWEATGLLEGLGNDQARQTMSRLLENQAKQLLKEASTMASGDVQGFASVAFPIVRRVFASLVANELVSVQAMSLPSGLIFFLDFTYGDTLGSGTPPSNRFGNAVSASIYGTDKVGRQVTGGVNLVGATSAEDLSGPRTTVGYSYSSPTGSLVLADSVYTRLVSFKPGNGLDEHGTANPRKLLLYDPDLLAMSGSGNAGDGSSTIAVAILNFEASASATGGSAIDYDNLGAFNFASLPNLITSRIGSTAKLARRLTQHYDSTGNGVKDRLRMVLVGVSGGISTTADSVIAPFNDTGHLSASVTLEVPIRDTLSAGGTAGGVGSIVGGSEFGLENEANIPEIDIKVDSVAVTAQTKKLKAKWSPELAQDLNAYHNLDAEVELTSILSEQIALEIDREILADLIKGATAGTYYWSRSPGMFLNRTTGVEVGASSKAPDFTGTVSEWYETLAETINDVSAQIHRKTLRGGANFVVTSPEVANILEFTAGFRASTTADADRGSIGTQKVGSISKKWDVFVDPYFPRNVVLVGRKGNSFLESGYVYAPYVPLQVTPTIFGIEDFVPRKGVMTRYAKKMVRPDMYGLVIIRGLLGESGG